jgi:hypothetical protein
MTWRHHFRLFLVALAFCLAAAAQKKTVKLPPPAPSPSPVVTEETLWPLPLKERDEFRDRQHEFDQIEIENQKMFLKIEQNKARQQTLIEEETNIATAFARLKGIDPAAVELDPAKIVLRKKKAK